MTARFVAELVPVRAALAHQRMGWGVAGMLLGVRRGECDCFACCRTLSPSRPVAAVLLVDPLDGEAGFAAAVCGPCVSQGKAAVHRQVVAALERDLGVPPGAMRAVHEEGRA